MTRLALALLLPLAALLLSCAPSQPSGGCETNADCAEGRFCAPGGECVVCRENAHCGEAQFCCQGECYDEGAQEEHCGCAAEGGGAGDSCGGDTNICLVDHSRATLDNVDEGMCGCSCDPAAGGTLCTVDGEGALACACNRSDPEGTCERPALDAEGNPHIVADTCSPAERCVCFAEPGLTACDAAGEAPDCTATGCVNALGDTDNCGVPGRVCTDATTGVADTGVCHEGGCSCDQAGDCAGTALNVNACAFVGDVSQCVCDDYEVSDGVKGACPLGLACVADGCEYNGNSYATRAALLEALGIP